MTLIYERIQRKSSFALEDFTEKRHMSQIFIKDMCLFSRGVFTYFAAWWGRFLFTCLCLLCSCFFFFISDKKTVTQNTLAYLTGSLQTADRNSCLDIGLFPLNMFHSSAKFDDAPPAVVRCHTAWPCELLFITDLRH